jgi:hypothetical protein
MRAEGLENINDIFAKIHGELSALVCRANHAARLPLNVVSVEDEDGRDW